MSLVYVECPVGVLGPPDLPVSLNNSCADRHRAGKQERYSALRRRPDFAPGTAACKSNSKGAALLITWADEQMRQASAP